MLSPTQLIVAGDVQSQFQCGRELGNYHRQGPARKGGSGYDSWTVLLGRPGRGFRGLHRLRGWFLQLSSQLLQANYEVRDHDEQQQRTQHNKEWSDWFQPFVGKHG